MKINLTDVLVKESLADCCEHLAALEADIVSLEKAGGEIEDQLANHACRAVHSVQKAAGLLNLGKIRDLAREVEDLLMQIGSRKVVLTADAVSVLLRATDRLQELVRNPETSNRADITDSLASLAAWSADRPIDSPKPGGRRLRALLVEDNFVSRLLLQNFLSRYGECHIAVNGKEAVEAFRSSLEQGHRYDLICMDILMPEMDGREAVRQVRALEEAYGIFSDSGAKIIMTTAVDDIKEVMRCFQELCDAYLTKPIKLAELRKTLKACRLLA